MHTTHYSIRSGHKYLYQNTNSMLPTSHLDKLLWLHSIVLNVTHKRNDSTFKAIILNVTLLYEQMVLKSGYCTNEQTAVWWSVKCAQTAVHCVISTIFSVNYYLTDMHCESRLMSLYCNIITKHHNICGFFLVLYYSVLYPKYWDIGQILILTFDSLL